MDGERRGEDVAGRRKELEGAHVAAFSGLLGVASILHEFLCGPLLFHSKTTARGSSCLMAMELQPLNALK